MFTDVIPGLDSGSAFERFFFSLSLLLRILLVWFAAEQITVDLFRRPSQRSAISDNHGSVCFSGILKPRYVALIPIKASMVALNSGIARSLYTPIDN